MGKPESTDQIPYPRSNWNKLTSKFHNILSKTFGIVPPFQEEEIINCQKQILSKTRKQELEKAVNDTVNAVFAKGKSDKKIETFHDDACKTNDNCKFQIEGG